MVIDKLMAALVKYYGEYENEYVKTMVVGYLERKIKETEFKNLLQTIYSYHKANFGAPCIATIKDCIDKARLKDNRYEPFKTIESKAKEHDYRKDAEEHPEEYNKNINMGDILKSAIKKTGDERKQ